MRRRRPRYVRRSSPAQHHVIFVAVAAVALIALWMLVKGHRNAPSRGDPESDVAAVHGPPPTKPRSIRSDAESRPPPRDAVFAPERERPEPAVEGGAGPDEADRRRGDEGAAAVDSKEDVGVAEEERRRELAAEVDTDDSERERETEDVARSTPEVTPTRRKPRAEHKTVPMNLSEEELRQTLGYAAEMEKSSETLDVKVRVIPDEYRFLMARDVGELRRAGYEGEELRERTERLHRKHKAVRGRSLFRISFSGRGRETRHFLQSSLKKCVEVVQRTKPYFNVLREEPRPRFQNWQIYELRPDQPRRIYRKALFLFDEMTFDVCVRLKEGDKTPVVVKVGNVVRVHAAKSKERTDALEGVNLGQRQIQTSNWKRLILPPIEFRFYPGRWKIEGTSDFNAMLDSLEG